MRIPGSRRTRGGAVVFVAAVIAGTLAGRIPMEVTLEAPCVVLPESRWSLSEIRPGTFESKTVDAAGGRVRHYRLYQYDRPALVELQIADPVTGSVAEEPCPVGRTVARIAASSLELELAERATALDIARARLVSLKAGAKPEEISRARLQVEEARAQQAATAVWYDRQCALFHAGQITQDEWEQASITCRLRDLDVQLAEADLRVAESSAAPDAVAAGEVAVANLERELTTLREITGRQEISAPLGGRLGPGRLPGELLTVTDPERMVIVALVPQRCAGIADRAERIIASIPGTQARRWEADVFLVDRRPVETAVGPMIRVFARADNTAGLLAEGMQGQARLHCGRRELGRWVRERVSAALAEELVLR